MNKYQLYRQISKNKKLAAKRHPMFERNKAMKIFGYCFAAFWAVYLIIIGIALAFGLSDASCEAYDYINGGFIIFLTIDFFMRLGMQETPAQDIKPYKLLPIKTNFLMDIFLIKIGLGVINLIWLFFFIPFSIKAIWLLPHYGFLNFLSYNIGIWLMFVANGYWYLFWRTFINQKMIYILCPTIIYGALIYFGMVNQEWLYNSSMNFMRGFINGNPLSYIGVIAFIFVFFLINRFFQKKFIYKEISKFEKVKNVRSREMSFLNRFGQIGEYLKLEIKSVQRNAVVRKQFITGVICMLMLCALFSFTEVYDAGFMRTFICVYCFACLGVITLTSIMCVEGNYIDGLMSRRESVLSLLKAKYYFNCMMMIVPILFILVPIFKGKVGIWEVLGCLFFTTGVIFPFLFQLAVYNNTTIHLTNQLTKSGQSSKSQIIVSMVALFVPMGIMYALITLSNQTIAGIIMCIIGLTGTILNPIWLRNIYKRFMNHRYENMAGFRQTR